MGAEGVVKFRAEHERADLPAQRYGELGCKLVAWREIMAMALLVGQDPLRYGGAGYGNVSGRIGPPGAPRGARSMLITGTQTSGLAHIGLGHLCVVERYDYERNWVRSHGPVEPSSESMTHGAIYDLTPAIRFVLHAHSPIIWRRARELHVPVTDPHVAYGTPEMAREIQRLYTASALSETRIAAMGGHEDGVIVFGESAERAGQVLLAYLARGYELTCRARH
ncbi:MAG: class II aldolase/adducin family protein [Deltaproteobacteria bacterium]|nr:class II aldolase/adducin family protein [Deltaproteobacteria bacterium]